MRWTSVRFTMGPGPRFGWGVSAKAVIEALVAVEVLEVGVCLAEGYCSCKDEEDLAKGLPSL